MEAVQNGQAENDQWDIDEGIARFLGIDPNAETFRLTDVRNKATSELKNLGDEITAHLDAIGVRIPPAVQFVGGEAGHIVVASEHADKASIETRLNGDTRVLKMFKEVELLFEILRKAELRDTERFKSQHFNLGLTSLGSIAFFTEA
ncbi:hypothetical protein [Jeongeupia chitinilytica]|uniref:Carrier domain-containing protein n=1 Tax=Jeongeupia chitinilytica TaxID=1041641 RepID=A0ABQ3H0A8_9NEIS|nr:hypothetical protein [Jeongeupia chitinilytica]GHD60961.1 hypothetical protein GCM10007350_14890 [Jeongeupia chitinilytica]